ncbi:MFS quinate transporter [Phlyctema vagabunda]|uniref:Quinate transporter n=1 Tax=Phlyctema vagabunda TaxID=108571 RepID=A0ABR4P6I9_9HELO
MAKNSHLYLSALIACLTSALFGYSVGFIGGLLVLPSFLEHFQLASLPTALLAAAQARIVTVWLVGALFGVPLGMPICSRWGRKPCLLFSATLYVLGTFLQIYGGGLEIFELGRLINGLGVGAGTLVSPMYISEISPPAQRGMLMSGYQTVLQLSALVGFWGAFVANALLPATSSLQWQIPVAIQLLPGILLLLGTFFVLPETPRFLAERGDFGGVEKSLAWLRNAASGEAGLTAEIGEIKVAARAGEVLQLRNVSFVREVMKKGIRKRLVVGVGLMIAQNMVGLNALNYYAPVIFMSAGFTTVSSSLFLTGLFGVVKLLSAIAFMFFFVRMKGNRFWLILGTTICGVSMIILGMSLLLRITTRWLNLSGNVTCCIMARLILLTIAHFVRVLPKSEEASLTVGGVISVVMVYIFAFSFAVSLGPISWNICSEIFPLHINAKCCTITTCTQWLFQILIAYITPRLLASVGWATYLIYAGFCLVTLIWVIFCVPETRGVPLGKAMDTVFGEKEGDEEDVEEVETTPLLGDRIRRGSAVSYS